MVVPKTRDIDGNAEITGGFDLVRKIAINTARADILIHGPFPERSNDEEELGAIAVAVVLFGLMHSVRLRESTIGRRPPLARKECWEIADRAISAYGDNETDESSPIWSPEDSENLIDRAFHRESMGTTLAEAVKQFTMGSIGRIMVRARYRHKVEDGTTWDGSRRRRYMPPTTHLGDDTPLIADKGGDYLPLDTSLDVQEAFKRLSKFQRAILVAYLVEDETLKGLTKIDWSQHDGPKLLTLKMARNAKEAAIHALKTELGIDYDANTNS